MKKRHLNNKFYKIRRNNSRIFFTIVFISLILLLIYLLSVFIKELFIKGIQLTPGLDVEVPGVTTEHFDVAVDKRNGNIHLVYQENTTKIYNRRIFNGASWSAPEPIPGINAKDKNPKIAVDSFGNAHIVFEREGKTKISYIRSTVGGWANPVDISQSDQALDGINDGSLDLPQIAIDSKNNVHIAAFLIPPDPAYPADTPFYYISKARYMFSKYNGVGWDAFTTQDKEYKGSSSTKSNGAHPAITIDKNDNLHMVYMGSPWAILVHEVRNPSGTWSTPQIIQCTNKQCPASFSDILFQGDGVGDFLDVEVDNNGVVYVGGQWTRAYSSAAGYSENYIALWSNNGKGSNSRGEGNWKRWRAYRYYWDPMTDVEVDSQGNVYMVWAVWTLGNVSAGEPWIDWSSTFNEPSPLCNSGESLVDRKAHYMMYNATSNQWITPLNDPCPPSSSDVLPNLGTRHRTSNLRSHPRLAVTSSGVWAFWIDRDNKLQLYMTGLSGQQNSIQQCKDTDLDGYKDLACGGNDCIDSDKNIHPGASEICGDGKDNDCSGGDAICQIAIWRSQMFPENWQPIDKIGAVDGLNIFTDSEGTKDPNGSTVTSGPNYHPKRFLHDFSYAGYQKGEKPIPPEDPNSWTKTAKVYNVVTQYGCVPDGNTDCRAAIQAAIDAAESAGGGVIYLPAGEYKIISVHPYYFLKIRTSKIVIRGDGADKTKIKVDPYMAGVFDMDNKMVFSVEYKVNNINQGWDDTIGPSVLITKDLPYPTKIIPVADVSSFKVGDPIVIQEQYTDVTLRDHDMVNVWPVGDDVYVWRRNIIAIDAAKKEITIDVPTRYRVKASENAAKVTKTNSGLSEIGFEHFSIGMIRHPDEWPDNDDSTSPIVLAITGNKVFYMYNVENSWMYDLKSYRPSENANRPTSNTKYGSYDIEILNNVLYAKDSRLVTAKDFYFKNMQVDGNPGGGYGYAFQLFRTNDILVENGTFQKVKKGSAFNQEGGSGNVIKDVVYKEIFTTENDFHSYLSASNLIDNNDLQGTYWEAAIRPIELLSVTGGTHHGHGTTQTVFWNTKGAALTIPVLDWWDRDNDNDNIRDENEAHGAIPDPGIIVSNQYGWGYIIGTYGPFSDVITARMADRMLDLNANGESDDDVYRPYILPRDYKEGIGYDKSTSVYYGKTLCPNSLYEAQLQLRLNGKIDGCSSPNIICNDTDLDGYKDLACGGNDCIDSDKNIHPGASEICGDGKDNDCSGGDAICTNENRSIIDNLDAGFSSVGNWQTSRAVNPYGTDSLYSAIFGDGASWTSVLAPGVYNVYAWWTYLPSRSQTAPYSIYNGDLLLGTVRVNQNNSALAGKWNLLGEYTFDKAAKITLNVEGLGSYSADAVSFIKVKEIPANCVSSVEVCNEKDDDCDGIIDEGVSVSFYKDGDLDTYGAGTAIQGCLDNLSQGYVLNNLDCNDNENSLNLLKQCSFDGDICGSYQLCVSECPFRNEICGNGVDEDCNGADLQCSIREPLLVVLAPEEKTYKNKPVPVKYNATQASNCGYYLNGILNPTACSVDTNLKLGNGKYSIEIFANNSLGLTKEQRNFSVVVTRKYQVLGNKYIESGSLGPLEDYSDEQLEDVFSLTIELSGVGKIEFLENVNLTKDRNQVTNIIDIDNNVLIDFNKVQLDPRVLSSLNKKAMISLEKLTFKKPIILKDGVLCNDCVLKSYSNGKLVFDVAGFSTYSAMETPVNDDGEGDGGGSYVKNGTGKDTENIGSYVQKQKIIVEDDVKFFVVEKNEEVILEIGGEEYIVIFDIDDNKTVLNIGEASYDILQGEMVRVGLGDGNIGPIIYVGVKENYRGKSIIGVSLDGDRLKEDLIEGGFSELKSNRFLFMTFLLMIIVIIAAVIILLYKKIKKPFI